MSPGFLFKLTARASEIQDRWRTLLRIEPVSGPLANPEALQYYIPEAWQQVLQTAAGLSAKTISLEAARAKLPDCRCGNNPYRAFFLAAEQALTEAAVLIQSEQPTATRRPSDLAELMYAVRSLAAAEVDTFCSACVHRGKTAACRFATAASGG